MRLFRGLIFWCLTIAFGCASIAQAKMGDPGWIFSPTVGVARPNLDPLFKDIFKAPFVGASTIVTDLPEDVQGASAYPREEFFFENELKPVEIAPEAGLEFRRSFGTRSDFVIGVSTWEISSIGRTIVTLPLQGLRNNIADYERRAKFSYTQYYLGWRRYIYERTRPYNVYFNLGLHEFFDVDYKETHVFSFVEGDPSGPVGFKRIAVYQSQSTGLLLMQFGLGVERLLAERFSLSLEGDFAVSVKSGTLRGLNQRSDFNAGDRLTSAPTPINVESPQSNEIVALLPDGKSREKVTLTLGGWRLMAKFNIAF